MIKDFIIFALVGAAVALLDAVHVLTGTLEYPQETWFFTVTKQPYWVPLLFGSAGIVAGFGHRFVVGDCMPKVSAELTIKHILVFLCCYAASGMLKAYPYPVAIFYTFIFIKLIAPRWRHIQGLEAQLRVTFFFVALFILGPLTEAFVSSTGRFQYEPGSRHLFNATIPIWLPPLYLTVATAVSSLDCYLRGHIVVPTTKARKAE